MFQEADIPKFKWNLGLGVGKRPHKSLTTKKVMNELEKTNIKLQRIKPFLFVCVNLKGK